MENGDYTEKAKLLRKAMKGMGTDEKAIIAVTASLTNKERIKVREAFKAEFNRDLIADFDDELSYNLKKTIIGLYRTPEEFDAHQLYEAFKGIGTDEDTVSEVLGTKCNKRMADIKQCYHKMFSESLEVRLDSETSGDYKKLLIGLLQCDRDESDDVDKDAVESDCRALYKAGEGKWGTDEDTFILIFSNRNSKHLKALNKFYEAQYHKGLMNIIDKEFSGDIKVLLKTIMQFHLDPDIYYANRIYKACKGWGTDDSTLIRVLITVSNDYSMKKLDETYNQLYNMTLEYQIKDETSGDYKLILLSLVKH